MSEAIVRFFAEAPVLREALTAVVVIFTDICALMILLASGRERRRGDRIWAKEGKGYMLVCGDTSFPLGAAEILIGRHISADIRMQEAEISRFHAILVLSEGSWRIEDLGSAGGTYVNGVRIHKPRMLRVNDKIRIGTNTLTVVRGSGRSVGE